MLGFIMGVFFVCLMWLCRVSLDGLLVTAIRSLQALSSLVLDGCISKVPFKKIKNKKCSFEKPTSNRAVELKGLDDEKEIFIFSCSRMLKVDNVEVFSVI